MLCHAGLCYDKSSRFSKRKVVRVEKSSPQCRKLSPHICHNRLCILLSPFTMSCVARCVRGHATAKCARARARGIGRVVVCPSGAWRGHQGWVAPRAGHVCLGRNWEAVPKARFCLSAALLQRCGRRAAAVSTWLMGVLAVVRCASQLYSVPRCWAATPAASVVQPFRLQMRRSRVPGQRGPWRWANMRSKTPSHAQLPMRIAARHVGICRTHGVRS